MTKLQISKTPNLQNFKTQSFKIKGMHCVSCGMNIDGELEELEGVKEARTSYARSETVVEFDPEKVSEEKFKEIIEKLGYEVN